MKKLWLSGIVILVSSIVFGQQINTLGTATRITKIAGVSIRLDYLKATRDSANKVLTIIDANGTIGYVSRGGGAGGYVLPAATTSVLGGVKVDGTSITIDGSNVIHATPGAGEPTITAGTTSQYWRGDKTFQNLVLSALTNWPTPVGQAGKFLTTDGTNYSWATASGGSGLSDAYATMTDGTTPATASGATTFKFRSANNRISLATANNDVTHGDNLLVTFNEGNVVLTESQVTNLTSDLSGKEPILVAGTNLQYYRGDKTWQTLNTSVVPEGSNLYFSNARVESYAVGVYSKLSHNHTLDGLSNVTITSKAINDILKWNGSAWVNVPIPSGGGSAPTIVLNGDVTGSGTPGITTTIAAGVVANSKLANMANATIKGRITSGTGVPEDLNMTQLKSSSMLDIANFPISNAEAAVNSAQATTNGLKMNIANATPTGTFDASSVTNFIEPRKTNAVLQTDTTGMATFGGGTGITGDTAWVTTSTVLGSFFNTGTDTLVVTNMNVVLQGSSPNVTVSVFYGTSLNTSGTAIVTAGTAVTNTTTGTNITVFNANKIPPGNHVWAKFTTVITGSKPTYASITLSGTKTRKG